MSIDPHRAEHLGTTAVAAAEAGVRVDRLTPAPWCSLLALAEAGALHR